MSDEQGDSHKVANAQMLVGRGIGRFSKTIGTCAICMGRVSQTMSINDGAYHKARCDACGALAGPHGPLIAMERPNADAQLRNDVLEKVARLCVSADKSTHPSDLAAQIRALKIQEGVG